MKGDDEEAVSTLRLPSHPHPLVPGYYADRSYVPTCDLCRCTLDDDEGYSCTPCDFYAHKRCAEAPPLIPRHPFHSIHPLYLSCGRPSFTCNACDRTLDFCSSLGCDECGFFLDLRCALSTLSDVECSEEEQIQVPVHDHPLTSFLATQDFRWGCYCALCRDRIWEEDAYLTSQKSRGAQSSEEEDESEVHDQRKLKRRVSSLILSRLSDNWTSISRVLGRRKRKEKDVTAYVCLHSRCKFMIHKRCVKDLYYEDGSMVPRVYHRHELATFSSKKGKSNLRCGNCEFNISSGEYFGCRFCQLFYHRDCVRAPEMLQYPPHPDHALILFIRPGRNKVKCQSCSFFVVDDLCYSCTGCDFALHVRCGLWTLFYCKDGRAVEIAPSWHEHPLLLCHRANIHLDRCSCCGDIFDGLAYRCNAEGCRLVLHERCAEQSSGIDHPHHPKHPLVLLPKFEEPHPSCNACCGETFDLSFSCELCRFYLHVGCASQFPTQKHYLHEHHLIRFEEIPSLECNRCGTSTDSPLLRCVPCDFNLHEKCTELPGVVKHKTHHHPLTLRDSFMEDNTGEYYCDLCEQRRDERLGVYMCLQCKMEQPWVFHIECVLPELQGVNLKKVRDSVLKESAEEVAKKLEQLLVMEKIVDETKRELEELRKKHAELCLLKTQGEEE